MSHIFVSYSKKDTSFVHYLRNELEIQGLSIWLDEIGIRPSSRWWAAIEKSIDNCAAFVVVMSGNSLQSEWVEREILRAESKSKPIFPILLNGEPWSRLANLQYVELTGGIGAPIPEVLLTSLKAVVPLAHVSSRDRLEQAQEEIQAYVSEDLEDGLVEPIEAISTANEILGLESSIDTKSEAETYYRIGNLFFVEGEYDKAVELFSRVIKLSPSHAKAYYNRAQALQSLGRFKEALEDFSNALQNSPDRDIPARSYCNRGITLDALSRRDDALLAFEQAITANPLYAPAYYHAARIAHEAGEIDKAYIYLERFFSIAERTGITANIDEAIELKKSLSVKRASR